MIALNIGVCKHSTINFLGGTFFRGFCPYSLCLFVKKWGQKLGCRRNKWSAWLRKQRESRVSARPLLTLSICHWLRKHRQGWHFTMPPLVPREMTSEKQLLIGHARMGNLLQPIRSSTQISRVEYLHCSLRGHFAGKPVVVSRMSAVFSG